MTDQHTQPASALNNIRIVLINTSHPGNIGGVARAMKNMGMSNLVLVSPKQFPDEQATWRAAGALDVLDNAKVVETLEDAIGDCQLVIGTSARDRRIPWPLLNPRECAKQAYAEAASDAQVALVFGREDRGMKNEELQRCNLHMHIPSNPEYSSLNLAMAVQVATYEVRMCHLEPELSSDAMADWDEDFVGNQDMERYYEHLKKVLFDIGFLKPRAPKQLMTRIKRIYQRTRLDEAEVSILRGILTATERAIVSSEKGKLRVESNDSAVAAGETNEEH